MRQNDQRPFLFFSCQLFSSKSNAKLITLKSNILKEPFNLGSIYVTHIEPFLATENCLQGLQKTINKG